MLATAEARVNKIVIESTLDPDATLAAIRYREVARFDREVTVEKFGASAQSGAQR